MAHRIHGLAEGQDHDHSHEVGGGHDHFHDHSHSATATATSRAQLGLVLALMGGLLILTSLYISAYAAATGQDYRFHRDAVALAGALLLGLPILWHAFGNVFRGHLHMDE